MFILYYNVRIASQLNILIHRHSAHTLTTVSYYNHTEVRALLSLPLYSSIRQIFFDSENCESQYKVDLQYQAHYYSTVNALLILDFRYQQVLLSLTQCDIFDNKKKQKIR